MRKFKKTIEYFLVKEVVVNKTYQVITVDNHGEDNYFQLNTSDHSIAKVGQTLKVISDFGVGIGMVDTFTVTMI